MSRRRGALSPEDEALWKRVAETVKPLRAEPPAPAPKPEPPAPPAPAARKPQAEPPPALFQGKGKPPWRGPAPKPAPKIADRGAEKRVRRGRVEIGAVLDLHGLNQDQARAAVHRFLVRAQRDGAGAVIVVTGKGSRAADGETAQGVLKRRLPDWLDERPELVSGYARAHRKHGGDGAVYVFLKRPRDTP